MRSGTVNRRTNETDIAVSLTLDDGTSLFSHVPESTFDLHPFRPGDRVLATWDPAKAQRLQ